MRLYARPSLLMARQVASDLWMVAWVVAWALAGRWVHGAVLQLAVPARQSANLAADLSVQMHRAQDEVGQLPVAGQQLSQPFGSLSGGLDQLAQLSRDQVNTVGHVAMVAAWLCFLVPVVTLGARWLPARYRFVRDARLAARFVDSGADIELFCLRGIANLPMHQLARISPDPVGSWRAGDQQVVEAIAFREMERTGLGRPAPVRPR